MKNSLQKTAVCCCTLLLVMASGFINQAEAETLSGEMIVSAAADTSDVLTVAEQMPEIIGGMEAVYSKIRYPRQAVRDGIEGRVFIQFVVDHEGNVRNPQVLRDIGGGCGDAALAAIKQVKFEPGMQNGEPVSVQYSMPVTFRIQN